MINRFGLVFFMLLICCHIWFFFLELNLSLFIIHWFNPQVVWILFMLLLCSFWRLKHLCPIDFHCDKYSLTSFSGEKIMKHQLQLNNCFTQPQAQTISEKILNKNSNKTSETEAKTKVTMIAELFHFSNFLKRL